MSHWNNFPACSFMTDFEIVVVQNERARFEWERLEQEQMNVQPQDHLQDHHDSRQHHQQDNDNMDNSLLVNILSNQRPETLPDPLTPIHPASEDPPMAHATTPQTEVELSQVDIAPNSDPIIDKDITLTTNANHLHPQTISDDKTLNQSLGNDSKLRFEMNRTKVSHKISLMKSSGNHFIFLPVFYLIT